MFIKKISNNRILYEEMLHIIYGKDEPVCTTKNEVIIRYGGITGKTLTLSSIQEYFPEILHEIMTTPRLEKI